ncbi:MAG: ATP-dependent DNA ligase [Thermoplasmata archaeon]
MRFDALAAALERLEANPSRLESRRLLADLIAPLRPPELSRVLYLLQGQIGPDFEGVKLGVAGSLAARALAAATHHSAEAVSGRARRVGDLGLAAAELVGASHRLETETPLTVDEVFEGLRAIATDQGEGSQERKTGRLAALFARSTPTEAKFLARLVLGQLRVGVREMTLLDALAAVYGEGARESREAIERAFNLSSDLGDLADRLARGGIAGIARVRLTPGRPVRPMLAERAGAIEEIEERMGPSFAVEYKYDGLRAQAHLPTEGPVRLFSRRLESIEGQFPEVARAIAEAVRIRPAIVEGECVPIDPSTGRPRPFQEISRRRGRKHDLDRAQAEVPVVFFAFDALLLGDRETYEEPYPKRREALAEAVRTGPSVRLAEQRVVEGTDEALGFFEEVVAEGAEGIVAKSTAPESTYRAGSRGFWWIKYKKEYRTDLADSIDGVIVGGFWGRGRRAGHFGAYLLSVYDPETGRFPTFCKVGSGLDDAALAELPRRLHEDRCPEKPPEVDALMTPDQWFRPRLVLEVRGAELSRSPVHRAGSGAIAGGSGLALRFPRFTGRIRDDKGPTEATTVSELLRLYEEQRGPRIPKGNPP